MTKYELIKRVRIELSTRCNSVCPDCPRNLRGVEILENVTFPLTQLYLDDIQKIFQPEFLNQLRLISVDGNFGDFVTAQDALEIVEFFKKTNPSLRVRISTNASARPNIWEPLGRLGPGVEVLFRLDGMKDTHYLYRQNTDWDLIIDNAKKFIAGGGTAIWAMIVFDHNQHQVQQCKELSEKLGFKHFRLINNPPGMRNSFNVFRRDKTFSHTIGNYQGTKNFEEHHATWKTSVENPEFELNYVKEKKCIVCETMTVVDQSMGQEIYISADGHVFPCCYTGFYPQFKSDRYSNKQLLPLMKENNALVYGIQHSIAWFENVVKSWDIPTIKQGRILICNETCGHDI